MTKKNVLVNTAQLLRTIKELVAKKGIDRTSQELRVSTTTLYNWINASEKADKLVAKKLRAKGYTTVNPHLICRYRIQKISRRNKVLK